MDHAGQELWRRDLEAEYGRLMVKFGYSASPLLHDGRLYVQVLQNATPTRYNRGDTRQGPLESFLLAIDPDSGETLWRHVRQTDATDESAEAYMTPIPYGDGAGTNVVLVGGECVTAHDPATGAEVWRWWFTPPDRKVWQRVVSGPVPGDGMLFVVRPKHRPVFALRPAGRGVLTDDCVAWSYAEQTPDVTTALLYNGRLYTMNDSKRVMVCLDPASGNVLWQSKFEGKGPFRASPTGADGKIYCMDQAGTVYVLKAGDEFEGLFRWQTGEAPGHSSIVAANGRIFIRTAANLYGVSGSEH
jgi:outer membrane protein assembly factor BamB